ncbi:MAG: hypothetical protein QXG00_06995 [Candidatus Woesearchaeota archaeon]
MLKKIIYICITILLLSCAGTQKLHYDTVIVKATDSYFINNWKKNGIKISNIDTIRNLKGEIEKFKVQLR